MIDLKHISALSKIEICENEIEEYEKDFSKIIEYINKLSEFEVEESKISRPRNLNDNNFRKDIFSQTLNEDLQIVTSEFPEKQNDYLKVPKIL